MYSKDFDYRLFPNSKTNKLLPIVSGRILTDNIVRIEYQNGCITHWRVKLKKRDCDKNLRAAITDGRSRRSAADGSVIWQSGALPAKEMSRYLSWDMDNNTAGEPVYPE